jgi:hypothetical protein
MHLLTPLIASKRLASIAAISLATCLLPNSARAEVIDFEDASPISGFYIPAGYKDFTWSGGSGSTSWLLAEPNADFYSAHSGTNYVWSNSFVSLTLAGSVFDFNGMWAFGANGSFDGNLIAHGFLNGAEIYTQTVGLTGSYSEVTLNFTGIDSLKFDGGYTLVIDDISVSRTRSVPESSSCLALFGLAVAGLVAVQRGRRDLSRGQAE